MPRHMRLASAVAFVVAAAMCFAMPALGTGDGLSFLAAWANEDEVGPHVESIAATADGSIVVADRKRDRVVRFTYGHAHAGSFPATDPRGIAVIPGSGYLIAEADRVRRTDVDGTTLVTYAADDPYGVALAGDTVLIADAADGRILRYRLDGAALPAWKAKLIAPRGLAVGPDGTVYAADAGRWRVETFSADGQDSGGWWVPDPHGVAVGPDGVVYVATNTAQRLKWFSSTGAYAGSLRDFGEPRGVAVDCRGTVTVADSSRHRLQSYGDPASPAPPCETPAPPPPRRVEQPPPAPGIEQPVLGNTAAITPVSGSVFFGEGARRRLLTARSIVPVETHIDATDGEVELTFETAPQDTAAYGEFQHGVFYDGAFTVHQGTGDSLVELRLTGEAPEQRGHGASESRGQAAPRLGKREGRVPDHRAARSGHRARHALAGRGPPERHLHQGHRGLRARGGVRARQAQGAACARVLPRPPRVREPPQLPHPAAGAGRDERSLGAGDRQRQARPGLGRRAHDRTGRPARPAGRRREGQDPCRDGEGVGAHRDPHVPDLRGGQ